MEAPLEIINHEAEKTIKNALDGIERISCTQDFVFLSTYSGEAWILEPKRNSALRLADQYLRLNFELLVFNEIFTIEDNIFIAIKDGKLSMFHDYPIEGLLKVIEFLEAE